MSDTWDTIAFAAGALTLKCMLTHILVARERVRHQTFEGNQAAEERNFAGRMIAGISKIGPSIGKDGIARLERQEKNSAENETYFMFTVLAAAQANVLPENASLIIKTFVGARTAHWFAHCFGPALKFNSGIRTSTYLLGAGANIYVAYVAFTKSM